MNADLYISQGRSHSMCQDYAGVRVDERNAVVVVCDGCSTSPHTDIGARLLARLALRELDCDSGPLEMMPVLREAEEAANRLCLPVQCLDATVLSVRSDGRRYSASIWGDGAIAVGYADGSIEITIIDYQANAPRYPAYDLDDDRSRLYVEMIERETGNISEQKRQQTIWFGVDGSIARHDISHPPLMETVSLCGAVRDVEYRPDIAWMGALTDGFQSFTRPAAVETGMTREGVPAAEALLFLFDDFVNLRGKFVERQVSWFLNDCVRKGWRHEDDFTFAAISFAD